MGVREWRRRISMQLSKVPRLPRRWGSHPKLTFTTFKILNPFVRFPERSRAFPCRAKCCAPSRQNKINGLRVRVRVPFFFPGGRAWRPTFHVGAGSGERAEGGETFLRAPRELHRIARSTHLCVAPACRCIFLSTHAPTNGTQRFPLSYAKM